MEELQKIKENYTENKAIIVDDAVKDLESIKKIIINLLNE